MASALTREVRPRRGRVARRRIPGPRDAPERALEALAHSGGPLRRALAALAGRLVETGAFEPLGFARLADYGNERLGRSARQLNDLARMHARLAELPRLEAALLSGALSWTQVRLVARVATPEDEARWIAGARRLPTRELAKRVRAVDRGSLEAGAGETETDEEGSPEEPRRTVQVGCTPAVQVKARRVIRLARREAGEKLPSWQALEVALAEWLSEAPTDAEDAFPETPRSEEGTGERPSKGEAESGEEQPPALEEERERGDATRVPPVPIPAFVAELMAGLDEAGPFEIDRRLRHAVALEQENEARMGPLLHQVATARRFLHLGIPSLERYARERLGMAPRKARALLRLERAARRAPALGAAYRQAKLSWVQAQALVPLVHLDLADHLPAALLETTVWTGRIAAWVAWAQQVSFRRLEQDVDRALDLAAIAPEAFARTAGLPPEAGSEDGASAAGARSEAQPSDVEGGETIPPERQTGAKPTGSGETSEAEASAAGAGSEPLAVPLPDENARFFFNAPADVARLFEAAFCSIRRRAEPALGRLPTRGEAFEFLLDHALAVWGRKDPRTGLENRIYARDGWRCAVPGCSSYRNLHAHHIVFRSHQGPDEEGNLITLCVWHHQRALHTSRRGLRIQGRAPDRLRFELGLRPGGPPLLRFRSGDLLERLAEPLAG